MQGCGGILRRPTGSFTSPNYPVSYPANLNCTWQITVEYGHVIEVTFDDLDLEPTANCLLDYISVSIRKFSTKKFS